MSDPSISGRGETLFGIKRKGILPVAGTTVPGGDIAEFAEVMRRAADYVAFVSAVKGLIEVRVKGVREPSACLGPDQSLGVCFLFDGSEGQAGKAYFFADFGSVWVDGEAGPRPQIPTEMIAKQVPQYETMLSKMLSGRETGVDLFTNMTRTNPLIDKLGLTPKR